MTKNTAKELYEKHADEIRTGSLACWKEDVKSDPSVTMFDKTESHISDKVNSQGKQSEDDHTITIS